jgi:hypothetical protein
MGEVTVWWGEKGPIRVDEMRSDHIRSCMAYTRNRLETVPLSTAKRVTSKQWLTILHGELVRRRIIWKQQDEQLGWGDGRLLCLGVREVEGE